MAGHPKGYVPAFDDHEAAAAFRQVFETGKVTGTKKKNDGNMNASGRTKESSNSTKYATPMARARQERRKEEFHKDGSDSSSSESTNTSTSTSTNNNNNNNNNFFITGGVDIMSKSPSLDTPIMNGDSLDKLETSSTPSSGEGASVHSDKSERSEKSAMYQARAAKAARARDSSVSAATTMEGDGDGEGEGEGGGGGGTGTPLKAGRFNRHLKDASGDGAGHLPKFGDWNSKPPTASGPGYTVMFKAASKERRAGGSVGVPPPRPGSGSPPRTGDLYKLVPDRRPKKPNKLLCCIISTTIE